MTDTAIVGGGCFWCIQAIVQRLKGVIKVQSGYAGGHIPNPSYEQVCTGKTGHAEVVRIFYNKDIISYYNILYIFMNLHDPTTLNRQGNDTGTQYRSIIMYGNQEQYEIAKKVIEDVQKNYKSKIVTELKKAGEFYIAEDYHMNYYNFNENQGYCRIVIRPKIKKLESLYSQYLLKQNGNIKENGSEKNVSKLTKLQNWFKNIFS